MGGGCRTRSSQASFKGTEVAVAFAGNPESQQSECITETDGYQTTVPETVRRALGLRKRDKIRCVIRPSGEDARQTLDDLKSHTVKDVSRHWDVSGRSTPYTHDTEYGAHLAGVSPLVAPIAYAHN